MGKILSEEGGRRLQRYQYRGGDFSLIYKYALTPLNEFVLRFLIPLWLAPNAITLLGLMATIFSHAIALYYSPSFSGMLRPYRWGLCRFAAYPRAALSEEVGPWWIYIVFGISLFVYQTLDNIDGKQVCQAAQPTITTTTQRHTARARARERGRR
jgi:ethanolaminephosphotransferase